MSVEKKLNLGDVVHYHGHPHDTRVVRKLNRDGTVDLFHSYVRVTVLPSINPIDDYAVCRVEQAVESNVSPDALMLVRAHHPTVRNQVT